MIVEEKRKNQIEYNKMISKYILYRFKILKGVIYIYIYIKLIIF
jgi:hypothetical protein